MDYATETLCLFELHFPLSFFDIMTHLTLHIIEELERPEASMAMGYQDDVALAFATEYFADFPHSRCRIWDGEEELRDSGELVMGKMKSFTLSEDDI